MPIVAFISPKGGAGKTTASLLLALGLSERGHRVAMIDSDPNKPLVHWAALPGKPEAISVHPAPTFQDIRDALREARRKEPEWIILDTEGSLRGAMAFAGLQANLVLTPLAASQLEANQAVKAAELVLQHGSRSGRPLPHRCILTRVPAGLKPKSIKMVVEQLRSHNVALLPTAIIEKEAFRLLFAVGGGFEQLIEYGAHGVDSAKANADAYLAAVLEVMGTRPPAPVSSDPL